MSVNELRSSLYYEKYIVIDPGDTELKEKQMLTEDDYLDFRETYGPNFIAEMGASAIKQLLLLASIKRDVIFFTKRFFQVTRISNSCDKGNR